jgi:hypothetical protein
MSNATFGCRVVGVILIPLSEDYFLVILRSRIHVAMSDFKRQSSEDNFRNLTFEIDRHHFL